jgi:hypothetical protein
MSSEWRLEKLIRRNPNHHYRILATLENYSSFSLLLCSNIDTAVQEVSKIFSNHLRLNLL